MSLTYKGEETFQTSFGSLLSIAVRILTLIMAMNAAIEVVMMNEPKINSLARPLSESDRNEMGELNFADYSLYIGVESCVANSTARIPPEVGQMTAAIYHHTTEEIVQ